MTLDDLFMPRIQITAPVRRVQLLGPDEIPQPPTLDRIQRNARARWARYHAKHKARRNQKCREWRKRRKEAA